MYIHGLIAYLFDRGWDLCKLKDERERESERESEREGGREREREIARGRSAVGDNIQDLRGHTSVSNCAEPAIIGWPHTDQRKQVTT